MPAKVWNVGDVLSAADMNVWTVPITAIKPADTNRNTTTTLTNDPDLQISVAAGCTYIVEIVGAYKGGTNGSSDAQFKFNTPAGSTGIQIIGRRTLASPTVFDWDYQALGGATNAGTNTTANILPLLARVSITTAGTAGTVALAWAQNTSSATNTTVLAGTQISAQRTA